MFTREEAEKRGWTFPTEDGFVCAVAPDGRTVERVASDTPYFYAARAAAEAEGEECPEPNTAAILAVSGEKYVEPPPPPAPLVLTPFQELATGIAAASTATERHAALAAWA